MTSRDRQLFALGLGLLACGAGLLLATGAIVGYAARSMRGERSMVEADPPPACAAPAWVIGLPVSTAAADQLARWAMLCADLDAGRIDRATYRLNWLAVTAPVTSADEVLDGEPGLERLAKVPGETVWAAKVVDVSSEWSESSWSAQQVLGPPDVFPAIEDNPAAWASSEEDRRVEHITVELASPHRASAVEVYETLNPGATVKVELYDAQGKLIDRRESAAAPDSDDAMRAFEFSCTARPVARVKVTLDSAAVPGWNELDAIGVRPCDPS